MRYDPDLNRLSLSAYRDLLRHQNLLPSRRMLLDGLDEKFNQIQSLGIHTAAELLRALSTPAKIDAASACGVSADYLKLLKREAGTLKPKSVPLRDFSGVPAAVVESLYTMGIKTSKAYFESGRDADGELHALCDLVRINGVGANAAKMLFDAGYRSSADVAAAAAGEMLSRIAADNNAHRYYQGTLGLKDMQFCIDMARILQQCLR